MLHDFQTAYSAKLVTPDEAVQVVKSGDWVDYTSNLGMLCCWTGLWQSAGMSSLM